MTAMELIKELADSTLDAIDSIKSKFAKVDAKLETLDEQIKDFEPFDPSELQNDIHSVKEAVNNFEKYDDSDIKETLEFFTKKHDERIKILEEKKEYDDRGLREQINGIKALLEKEVTAIKKELETPVKVEIPSAKHYDGEPTEGNQFIIHKNALYMNLLEKNVSEPSDANASYMKIIDAPKSPVHKGVYNKDNPDYEYNDMVAWENSTWIKTEHPSQEIPSEGWKLVAKGSRGRKGEKGDKGDTTIIKMEDTVVQDLYDEINVLKATIKGYENAINAD